MSKRIRLSDMDMVLITVALEHLNKSSIINPGAYPEFAIASKQRIGQIVERFGAHSALNNDSDLAGGSDAQK